jgi:hypothetical protein
LSLNPQGSTCRSSSKENANLQQPAHYTKPDPASDIIKFMKDVKSELGALRSIVMKLEAALSKTDATQSGKEKSKKLHASLARQKKVKGQRGPRPLEAVDPSFSQLPIPAPTIRIKRKVKFNSQIMQELQFNSRLLPMLRIPWVRFIAS